MENIANKTFNNIFFLHFQGECNDIHDWAVQLLEHLIALAVKSAESLNALESFISEVTLEIYIFYIVITHNITI